MITKEALIHIPGLACRHASRLQGFSTLCNPGAMASDISEIVIDPSLRHFDQQPQDTDDIRSDLSMSDRLTIDVDCPPLGTSACSSMTSSFSSLDSPTPTPTSLYSHSSLSPGWSDRAGSGYSGSGLETNRITTPLKSSLRMANITAEDGFSDGLPVPYDNVDKQDKGALFEFVPGYNDNVEQFWIQYVQQKPYDQQPNFACQSPMEPQYPQLLRGPCYRGNQGTYLPDSGNNPCLSRPIFQQPERLPSTLSMNGMNSWMPSGEMMTPQTITPAQAFPDAPMTPPPSFCGAPDSAGSLRTHTPVTPVRSVSIGGSPGNESPLARLSNGQSDHTDEEFALSPGGSTERGTQRQASKKVVKRSSSKQSLKLENLPSIIKQVQFRCQEPGCKSRFKRQEHLKRHMKSHSKEKPHVCWVPGCGRGFSRSDNLNAHYTKTHSKRGGRNRYVATLDETSPDYDPDFRGQLTPDGRPIYGSKLDDPMPTTESQSQTQSKSQAQGQSTGTDQKTESS